MGLIVPEYHVGQLGLTLSNCYVAIAKNPIVLTPDPVVDGVYGVITNYCVWASQAVRDSGGQPVRTECLQGVYDRSNVYTATNLYATMYYQIRDKFVDPIDVDDTIEPKGAGNVDPVGNVVAGNTEPVGNVVAGNTEPVGNVVAGNTEPVGNVAP